MSERMLVTQALDERDLLVKKIGDKIDKAHFAGAKKKNEEKVIDLREDAEVFSKNAESDYQSVNDLIARFNKIDAAVVKANAENYIETTYGRMTVAGAISLRNRMKGCGSYNGEADFEGKLLLKLQRDYQQALGVIVQKNKQLELTASEMRISILGKDTKTRDDKPLAVVDAYIVENSTELVDPIEIKKKIDALTEKRNLILRELDTQIKVSNATTFIEID